MKRRELLRALAAAALVNVTDRAHSQPAPRRVAWVAQSKAVDGALFLDALRNGLRERGYSDGREIRLEAHWGDESAQRVARLLGEVAASRPAVILALGPPAVMARRTISDIPVVYAYSGDPVAAGLIESLARPGGNVTGMSFLTLELVGKRIELLLEVLPRAKRIAVVASPEHPGDSAERRATTEAAKRFALDLKFFDLRGAAQMENVLAVVEQSGSEAVMFFPVQSVMSLRERIARWSLRTGVPAMSGWAQFAEAGNLMTYGPDLQQSYRRLAHFVDRILRGTKPADLPAELPTQVEMVVNMRTARSLGISVPQSVLLRADRVVE
ncbi:MAG: ABC transporter substrate-binding protein [Betaproteobacteria bacterium]